MKTNKTIIITAANWCAGVQITDTGGAFNEYKDAETYVRTIIPNLANRKIALTFTAFDLEKDYDYLYVYVVIHSTYILSHPF